MMEVFDSARVGVSRPRVSGYGRVGGLSPLGCGRNLKFGHDLALYSARFCIWIDLNASFLFLACDELVRSWNFWRLSTALVGSADLGPAIYCTSAYLINNSLFQFRICLHSTFKQITCNPNLDAPKGLHPSSSLFHPSRLAYLTTFWPIRITFGASLPQPRHVTSPKLQQKPISNAT